MTKFDIVLTIKIKDTKMNMLDKRTLGMMKLLFPAFTNVEIDYTVTPRLELPRQELKINKKEVEESN